MSRLTLLTFGGFEVRRGSRRLGEFESWRARALAAFLVAHRGQAFSRDHLANLLWPEWEHDSARRNLRQALYDLRRRMDEPSAPSHFLSDGGAVRFELGDGWLDLQAFESALTDHPGEGEPTALAEAVRLYRGDFLAGLEVGGSLELEEWLIQKQEGLRETVVASLRRLVDHYLATGGYSVGIHYARRLLDLEPLSDESHRKLMRLYALTGRRNRALAQYRELRDLLARELDVKPLPETESLYQELRRGVLAVPTPPPRLEPVGPVVPLAGRNRELAQLREAWSQVARGRGRVTLVHGEVGVGKTRLIRTSLDRLGVSERATVILGRYFCRESSVPLQGIRHALEAGVGHEAEATGRLLEEASEDDLQVLARVSGRLRELAPQLWSLPEGVDLPAPVELGQVLARTLPLLGRRSRPGAPPGATILYLDDLDAADPASTATLAELARHIDRLPVWLLVTARTAPAEEDAGAVSLLADPADRIEVHPLPRTALKEISAALVGEDAAELTDFLEAHGGGWPLLCSQLVNLLWDRGILARRDAGWALTRPAAEAVAGLPAETLEEVVRARFRELPPSARRVVALAAVAGPRFGVPLLCAVEGEDERVIEATIHLLLERWWIRLHLGYWPDSRRERDLTLWTGKSQASSFEFGHEAVRDAVHRLLGPERRQVLHDKVLAALEHRSGSGREAKVSYHREAVRASN